MIEALALALDQHPPAIVQPVRKKRGDRSRTRERTQTTEPPRRVITPTGLFIGAIILLGDDEQPCEIVLLDPVTCVYVQWPNAGE